MNKSVADYAHSVVWENLYQFSIVDAHVLSAYFAYKAYTINLVNILDISKFAI